MPLKRKSTPAVNSSGASTNRKEKGWKIPPAVLTFQWPADEEAVLQSGDLEGWYALHMEKLRLAGPRTKTDREELAKYDALERRIQNEPRALLDEACEMFLTAIATLSRLAQSRRLIVRLERNDGSLYRENDCSCSTFVDLLHGMIRQFIMHAQLGRPGMRTGLFFAAKELTEAFMRIAHADPEDFREVAESSLTMPSLRARNPDFTAGAGEIAKAIHLGEKHPAGDITDNRSPGGAEAHLLVATILEKIHWQRAMYERERRSLEIIKRFSERADEYRGVELDEYLRSTFHTDHLTPLLACAALPEWEKNPEAWRDQVLTMAKQEFDAIARNPKRNPRLWRELGKSGETLRSTVKDRWRVLEKLCRNKFSRFVRAAHRKPARGQAG